MKEKWKDIEGYDGIYQVSTFGRVRSLDRLSSNNKKLKGKILKQKTDSTKYFKVGLYKNSVRENLLTHRIVAKTFIPNEVNKLEVNHKDCNQKNNNVSNLEWTTHKENMIHASKNKLFNTIKRKLVTKQSMKPVIMSSLDEKDLLLFDSQCEASKETGTSQGEISDCCLGKRKSAQGYHWRFQ